MTGEHILRGPILMWIAGYFLTFVTFYRRHDARIKRLCFYSKGMQPKLRPHLLVLEQSEISQSLLVINLVESMRVNINVDETYGQRKSVPIKVTLGHSQHRSKIAPASKSASVKVSTGQSQHCQPVGLSTLYYSLGAPTGIVSYNVHTLVSHTLVSHTVKSVERIVKNERSCAPLFVPFGSGKFALVC